MKKYQPSNGSEGDWFIGKYCANCYHEQFLHTQDDDHKICEILSNTMCFTINDPDYPEEWQYNEQNKPICTKFKEWHWEFDENDNLIQDISYTDDPNQLKLL